MVPDYQLLDAARFGDVQSAREAIARGANIHAGDFNRHSSLYLACTHGHLPMADLLVEHGADVNEVSGKRKQTLMHWAAEQGSFGIASFLLSNKANVNAQQADGSTPLLLAAKRGHHYLVQLLLKNDALLSPRNARHATARSAANRGGHHEIVKLIDAAAESRPASLQAAEEQFRSHSGQRTLF